MCWIHFHPYESSKKKKLETTTYTIQRYHILRKPTQLNSTLAIALQHIVLSLEVDLITASFSHSKSLHVSVAKVNSILIAEIKKKKKNISEP